MTEEQFLKDVSKHVMTIVRDDGMHRHLRFKNPDSHDMYFNIVTYPHFLCYSGDMGCFVFSRIDDMFQFFRGRSDSGPLRINLGYWSEKLEAVDKPDGFESYDPDAVEKYISDWLDENEASDEVRASARDNILDFIHDGDMRAYDAMTNWEYEGRRVFQDSWESGFTKYTGRFIWCCFALVWAIRHYDAAKATQASGASA